MIAAYHGADGTVVDVPDDLTTTVVAAHIPTTDGYRTIAGTGDASGTFRVDEVPAGEFVLQLGDRYYVTSSSDVDGGVEVFGRANAAPAATDATVTLGLTGFEPFGAGDLVQVLAPDAYNFALPFPLERGATTLAGTWTFGELFGLDTAIDAAHGDRLLVLQYPSSTGALTRALVTDGFTLTSGTATLAGALSPLPQQTLQTRILTDDLGAAGGPPPVEVPGQTAHGAATQEIQVSAMPGKLSAGNWGPFVTYAGDVRPWSFEDGGDRAFTYGVLGDGWVQYVSAEAKLAVRYRADPALVPTTLYCAARIVDSAVAFAGATVGPRISAPRDVRVGAADFLEPASGGGVTPLLSWTAPELGAASWYELQVWELSASGERTTRTRGPLLVTAGTRLRVPPGVLVPGHAYVFELKAVSVAGIDRRIHLRRRAFPLAEATAISGVYVP
jgi:hypothetical protein